MYINRVATYSLSAVILFWASCVAEPTITADESALGRLPSSLAPPGLPVAPPEGAEAPTGDVIVPGARLVGYYDMTLGSGQPYEVPPITAATGNPVNIADPTAAALANLNVFWVFNQNNGGFGTEYLARLADIATAVQNGMILVIHDRSVTNAAANLPAGAGLNIVRDFSEDADVNIRDASTSVTVGLTDASLDFGTSSSHGFALDTSMPARSKLILTTTTTSHVVTFCYSVGRGAVIYSTIPLDFYLQGLGLDPPQNAMRFTYAPNVVNYALAGACALRGPRPTPNAM
jgi:hypothetical protein